MKNAKNGRDQREIVSYVGQQGSLDFAPKHRVAEVQSGSSFKEWCHLPRLSDVEIRMGLLKLGCEPSRTRVERKVQIKEISANADPH